MLRIDIGCGIHKAEGFLGVDIISAPGVDIVADLSKSFPFSNSSVDELRAHDFIEHLANKIHTMNEIWRVCKPGAKIDIRVPSTDGRGAFQDPTHTSFWNINSFFYYCIDFPDYWQLCRQYGFQGAFKVISLEHEESPGSIIHVKANLLVVKSENSLVPDGNYAVAQLASFEKQQSKKLTLTYSNPPNFDLADLLNLIELYKKNPSDVSTLANLRQMRQQIANHCLKETLNGEGKNFDLSDFLRQAHNAFLQSTISSESMTESEQVFVDELVAVISQEFDEPKTVNYLLAVMLYCRADQLRLQTELKKIPQWFLKDYLKFLLTAPRYFKEIREADHYYQYLLGWVNYLHDNITKKIHQSSFWKDVALHFLENANFLQVYFNEENLKEIYVKRAEILELFLQSQGHQIDYEFREVTPLVKKIRLGLLASHFMPAPETFASLPIYEYISRDFEVILYSLNATEHPLEQYCRSCANSFKLLPNSLTDQVNLIREDDLDILFIATNVTIGTNLIGLLALHRLARVQVTSVASVVTTGIRNVDYYISGELTEVSEDAQKHYQEKLIKIQGAAHCFSYGSEVNTAQIEVNRECLGISQKQVVFISGANAFKIIPELRHSWAKILAKVPNSVLILYPWGPNWSGNYPKQFLTQSFHKIFAQYGVQPDQLIILDPDPVPNRDDIKKYLKLADIYLDSYPFSGTTSIIDPLEVDIPVVTRQGNYFRGAMGAALLIELGIPELVVNSEESYIQLAISLGINSELRQEKSQLIKQQMQKKPRFLDSRSYSVEVETLFHELIRTYWADALSNELRLRDINLIIFPDWKQPEESLLQYLTSVIREVVTHPNRSQITLLVDTSNISDEEADIAVSSVVMNLLIEEDLDVSEGAEISLIGERSEMQWDAILRFIDTRIIFERENPQAIIQAKAESISSCELERLSEKRAVQLDTGTWELRERSVKFF